MQRRDVEMLIVTLVVGPALAPFILFILVALFNFGPIGLTQLDFGLVFATLMFAYLLAAPAALAIGVANAVAARFTRSEVLQLLLALPIGALCFGVGLAWLGAEDMAASSPMPPAAIPLTGALVSLICVAIVGTFGTPLRGRQ